MRAVVLVGLMIVAMPAVAQERAPEPVRNSACTITLAAETMPCASLDQAVTMLGEQPELRLTVTAGAATVTFVVPQTPQAFDPVREVVYTLGATLPLRLYATGDCSAAPAGDDVAVTCRALTPMGLVTLAYTGAAPLAAPAAATAYADGFVSCRLTLLAAAVDCADVMVTRTSNGLAVSATTAEGGVSLVTAATPEGEQRLDVIFIDSGPGDPAMLGAGDGVSGLCRIEPLPDGHERITCDVTTPLGAIGLVTVNDGTRTFL